MPKIEKAPPTGPEIAAFLGLLTGGVIVAIAVIDGWLGLRKATVTAKQEEDLRRLVDRYEQLAETTLDAQQRTAADVAELRVRTAAVEQILKSVE